MVYSLCLSCTQREKDMAVAARLLEASAAVACDIDEDAARAARGAGLAIVESISRDDWTALIAGPEI